MKQGIRASHYRGGVVAFLGALLALGACGDGAGRPVDVPDVPLSIQKHGGDGQTDTVLATLPAPLQVRVFRRHVPVQGVTVRWEPDDQPVTTGTTDASGVASYLWTLGPRSGFQLVKVRLEHSDGRVDFEIDARPGRPVALAKDFSGGFDGQVGVLGAPLLWRYFVFAHDAHGNAAHGSLELVWEVKAGGGSIVDICSVECWCPIPAADCNSEVIAQHVLGPEEGLNVVTVKAPGLPGVPELTWTATGVTAHVHVRTDVAGLYEGGFVPNAVTIPAGKSVGWTWVGDYDPEHAYLFDKHDLVFEDDLTRSIGSPPQNEGTLTRTFTTPGTYRYRCSLHTSDFGSGEVGLVTVTEILGFDAVVGSSRRMPPRSLNALAAA